MFFIDFQPPNSPLGNGDGDSSTLESENKNQDLEKLGIQLISTKENQLRLLKGKIFMLACQFG